MPLSSFQLQAFSEVVRLGNFSGAAHALHVTQSALSQRILNLEKELGTALLIRDPSGLRLTAAGEELLRYSKVKDQLEREALSKLGILQEGGRGRLRIAGFSTVMRSVVMPLLDGFVGEHPEVELECFSRELRELPGMLRSGEADLILTTAASSAQDWVSHPLGYEENVLVERKAGPMRKDVYLDHDTDDLTTLSFLKLNGLTEKDIRRNYLDDIYSILDGVKLGWGRAVVPKHLLKGEPGIRILKTHKPLKVPVVLHYFHQPYYSSVHARVVACLERGAGKHLG